jgi:restriction system protein
MAPIKKGPGQLRITWILDLIPDNPRKALDVLDSYFVAHCSFMPEGRMHGMADAEVIIRHRYIGILNSRAEILSLTPIEFEFLVAALYEKMGFTVRTTKISYDGGIDIIAESSSKGKSMVLVIQCKKHKDRIPVSSVRELMGVVAQKQVNKGVIVSSSDFTPSAKKFARSNPMIELVGFKDLNTLLNEQFGPHRPINMTMHIRSMQSQIGRAPHQRNDPGDRH